MRFFIVCIGFIALLSGQNRILIEGRLVGGGTGGGMSVEVSEGSGKIRLAAVPVNSDSSFRIEVPSEAQGFEFRVLNRYGDVIQVSQQWPMRGASIELRLPGIQKSSAMPGISIKRLEFRPSSIMRRALAHSQKLSMAGKKAEAMAALEDIVKTEPSWFEAWVELGNKRAALGEYSSAVEAFREALAIDPNVPEIYPSLGLALMSSRRIAEAEQIAMKGIKLNPDCFKSKYVLGLALATARQTSQRAVALLDEVQSNIPEAIVPLAALLLRQGRFEESRDAAWRYLHIARAPRAELASSIWREASVSLRLQK